MDNPTFRQAGHRVVDWMADYLETVSARPVTPSVHPGEIARQLPSKPPEDGESLDAILHDLDTILMPGMAHWGHPRWFAYFPANTSPPSILAEMVTATLGAQCMSWATAPAATELEQVMMSWLGEALGLPAGLTGCIQDTASSATLVAILTARDRHADDHHRLTVYTSVEAHSSVQKSYHLAGFAPGQLRLIPTDDHFAMDPGALQQAIRHDRGADFIPAAVVATVGTTSSTAIDPVRSIGEITAREDLWLHVDAAYGGSAAVVPEYRHLLDGLEYADSFVFNPHKWLLVNFDCSAYYVRDVAALHRTFGSSPAYLATQADTKVVNYRDWGIPLGRRFRALKIWFVLRTYGLSGLREMIRRHVALAQEFAGWVDDDPHFLRVAPTPLGLVCFRAILARDADPSAEDRFTRRLLASVNRTGRVHLTSTELAGRAVMRMAIGGRTTTRADVVAAWDLIRERAAQDRRAIASGG